MKHDILAKTIRLLICMPARQIQALPLTDCAIMLEALNGIKELDHLCEQLARRLRKQLAAPLWIEDGEMGEVFSALVALWQYNPMQVTGKHLAAAVQHLIKTEITVGGPYASQGVIAVPANTQIAIFMRLAAEPLPKVDAFLAQAIATKNFTSGNRVDTYLIYLLAKTYSSPDLAQYVAHCRHQKDWQTPASLAIALAVLKKELPTSKIDLTLETLQKHQLDSGLWEGEAHLSPYATTALIVGIVAKFVQDKPQAPILALQHQQSTVIHAAQKMFNGYAEPLRSAALAAINQIGQVDRNFEITLLPQFFAEALKNPIPLTAEQGRMLSLANLYIWIAYTIYDDFLDGEGQPAQLPIANIAMRASVDCFRAALPAQDNFQQYVAHALAAMDEADAWEVARCRFVVKSGKVVITHLPDYNGCATLAARSFAHALGPMAILAWQSSGNAQRIESAFRHYLIARQLNDDLHDWLEDIQAGQASYVVTAILRDLNIKPGTYRLSALVPSMQRCFRQTTMPRICRHILLHTKMSKHAFTKSCLLRADNHVYVLLHALELSVQHSLDTYAKAKSFTPLQSNPNRDVPLF
jgi:hypothetical protein